MGGRSSDSSDALVQRLQCESLVSGRLRRQRSKYRTDTLPNGLRSLEGRGVMELYGGNPASSKGPPRGLQGASNAHDAPFCEV